MPAQIHVGQVDEEIRRQRPDPVGEDSQRRSVVIDAQHAKTAHQHRHLVRGQTQKLGAVEHHLFRTDGVAILHPVAETVRQRLERIKGLRIGLFGGRVTTTRREGHGHVKTGLGNGVFQTHNAAQHDDIGHRRAGLFRDGFEHGQHAVQTQRFIALPVLLRGQSNTRPIGAAALVGATEGPGAVPGCGDQLGRGQVAVSDLRFHRVHIVTGRSGRDRVLPDQILIRHERADIIGLGPHVAVGQLEPGPCERIREVFRILAEFLADRVIGRVHLHRHVRIGHDGVVANGRV